MYNTLTSLDDLLIITRDFLAHMGVYTKGHWPGVYERLGILCKQFDSLDLLVLKIVSVDRQVINYALIIFAIDKDIYYVISHSLIKFGRC